MLFNSLKFMIFFPIVTILFYFLPKKLKHIWLLGASLYFYMSWNPKYVLLMGISILTTYLGGIMLDWPNGHKKTACKPSPMTIMNMEGWGGGVVGLVFTINILILLFFKYINFFLSNVNGILNIFNKPVIESRFDFLLPVGISFYTFQALGYIIDVYRKK